MDAPNSAAVRRTKRFRMSFILKFLFGPWMILPMAFLFTWISLLIFGDPPELHGNLNRALFLQGNTDWGGASLFAATIGLYVAFGFTSAWYLVLKLRDEKTPLSFGKALLKSLWILKFHILAFLIGGTGNFSYDMRVAPNDFRNLFLFACLIYTLSIVLIAFLYSKRLPLWFQSVCAPLFIIVWLIVGSDGNTARAGQFVTAGVNPQPITRSRRHAVMLFWHHLCDSLLGDIEKPSGR